MWGHRWRLAPLVWNVRILTRENDNWADFERHVGISRTRRGHRKTFLYAKLQKYKRAWGIYKGDKSCCIAEPTVLRGRGLVGRSWGSKSWNVMCIGVKVIQIHLVLNGFWRLALMAGVCGSSRCEQGHNGKPRTHLWEETTSTFWAEW